MKFYIIGGAIIIILSMAITEFLFNAFILNEVSEIKYSYKHKCLYDILECGCYELFEEVSND